MHTCRHGQNYIVLRRPLHPTLSGTGPSPGPHAVRRRDDAPGPAPMFVFVCSQNSTKTPSTPRQPHRLFLVSPLETTSMRPLVPLTPLDPGRPGWGGVSDAPLHFDGHGEIGFR